MIGSPDASGNIANSVSEQISGIVKVTHQKNTGQGGARNLGIELAQGEYILFVMMEMILIVTEYVGDSRYVYR